MAGSRSGRYEAIMTISLALVDKCDAILVIAESRGVKRERDLIRAKSLRVYEDISDVPLNIG
jgi:hypothetical protein